MAKLLQKNVIYFPHPSEGAEALEEALQEIDKLFAERDILFPRQLRLVKRCAFWPGFLYAVTLKPVYHHFKWCPLHSGGDLEFGPLEWRVLPRESTTLSRPPEAA